MCVESDAKIVQNVSLCKFIFLKNEKSCIFAVEKTACNCNNKMKKALLSVVFLLALANCANSQLSLGVAAMVSSKDYCNNAFGLDFGLKYFPPVQIGFKVYHDENNINKTIASISSSGNKAYIYAFNFSPYIGTSFKVLPRIGLYVDAEAVYVDGLGFFPGFELSPYYYISEVIRISLFSNLIYMKTSNSEVTWLEKGSNILVGVRLSYDFNLKEVLSTEKHRL